MGRRLGRIPQAHASYEKALALAQQEPDRRFPARRIEELKQKYFAVLSIFPVHDDYRMKMQCAKAVLLARRPLKEGMTQYWTTIQLPDDFDPSSVDKAMEHDIDALNEEMEAKGVRLFAGGLRPAREAKSLRAQPDGKVLITDGPYLETKEHVGGLSILEAPDMDEVLAWAGKGAVACRAPDEVRPFFRSNVPSE